MGEGSKKDRMNQNFEKTLQESSDGVDKSDKKKQERNRPVSAGKSVPNGKNSSLPRKDVDKVQTRSKDRQAEKEAPPKKVKIVLKAEDAEDIFDREDVKKFDRPKGNSTVQTKKDRGKKRGKIVGIIVGAVAGTALLVYLGFSLFFMSHFYFHTSINGVEFSAKSVEDVEQYMERQVKDYELELNELDKRTEAIRSSDIDLIYKRGKELEKLMKEQNAFLWPQSLWKKPEIQASVGVIYDEEKLGTVIQGLFCMDPENQVEPESAKPEFDGSVFVVKPEVAGSKIDTETFNKKIKESIEGLKTSMDLEKEGCYVKPKYVSDSQEVLEACDTMNQYFSANVTYTFGSAQEVVDRSLISQWVSTDENMAVTFNQDAVAAYVRELASKYNTYQHQRSFISGNGNTVTVEGGDYGWILDREAESKALIQNIENGEVVTREPIYSQTAATHDGPDWGNTYVEVDLTNQNMYLFVNGALVVSGPIVTGKPSIGDATPQGVYSIKYCQKDATLRGPKQPDGSYEWESPVSFWMPFNGGIGLHDAPWQAAYGGDRYLTHGSHGCVNLQYDVAKTVFDNVKAGTPVVCHF